MKHKTTSQTGWSLGIVLIAVSVGCAGRIIDVGAAAGGTAAIDGGASSAGLPGDVVVAGVDIGGVAAMAMDAQNFYFASYDGSFSSLPRAGGERVILVPAHPVSTYELAGRGRIAIDQDYVYPVWGTTVGRVPKAGGLVEVVTDQLPDPWHIALDATYLYVVVNPVPGMGIIRIPKNGGPSETVVATQPQTIPSIVLTDADVIFATGWDEPSGSIRRVSKSGGEVQTLASDIDTRQGQDTYAASVILSLVVTADKVGFIEPFSMNLALVPISGGAVTRTKTGTMVGLLGDTSSSTLLGLALPDWTSTASLVRFDAAGSAKETLATWSYDHPAPSVRPAEAFAVEAGRVFWVDDEPNGRGGWLSTIRSAPLPADGAPIAGP